MSWTDERCGIDGLERISVRQRSFICGDGGGQTKSRVCMTTMTSLAPTLSRFYSISGQAAKTQSEGRKEQRQVMRARRCFSTIMSSHQGCQIARYLYFWVKLSVSTQLGTLSSPIYCYDAANETLVPMFELMHHLATLYSTDPRPNNCQSSKASLFLSLSLCSQSS
jgi:hypothetical protein